MREWGDLLELGKADRESIRQKLSGVASSRGELTLSLTRGEAVYLRQALARADEYPALLRAAEQSAKRVKGRSTKLEKAVGLARYYPALLEGRAVTPAAERAMADADPGSLLELAESDSLPALSPVSAIQFLKRELGANSVRAAKKRVERAKQDVNKERRRRIATAEAPESVDRDLPPDFRAPTSHDRPEGSRARRRPRRR